MERLRRSFSLIGNLAEREEGFFRGLCRLLANFYRSPLNYSCRDICTVYVSFNLFAGLLLDSDFCDAMELAMALADTQP